MTTGIEFFGDFKKSREHGDEYLALAFSPSSRPVNDRWRNNGLSADFLADYFGTFIPKEMSEAHHNQVKGAVAYIANELLENAMKFSQCDVARAISLTLDLSDKDLCFTLVNAIDQGTKEKLTKFLDEFTSMDAGDYFVAQMERNIENGTESGLGFATMTTDHEAQLGWKCESQSTCFVLTTQVVIHI